MPYKINMKTIKKLSQLVLVLTLITALSVPAFAEGGYEGTREETVYGLLKADGSVEHIIVSEHIQKNKELETIQLNSDLNDIELLMDSVEMVQENGTLAFTTLASDLYYRGNSNSDLPVSTAIEYVLDGVNILPEDLAGQTGHLKITISQINHEMIDIEINGVQEQVYLPFESAVVVSMDNQLFENVTITSGKILDDGAMKVLTTVLSPGVRESLGDLESELITDYVVIEADVNNVEMESIYMTTICKLPDIDINSYLSELTDMTDQMSAFESAGHDLVAGADDLNTGIQTYFGQQTVAFDSFNTYLENDQAIIKGIIGFNEGFTNFSTALNMYVSGVGNLITGIGELSTASPALVEGLSSLRAGLSQVLPESPETAIIYATLDQLEGGANALNAGLQQAQGGALLLSENAEGLLDANTQLAGAMVQLAGGAAPLLVGNEQLVAGIGGLSEGSVQVIDGVQNLDTGVHTFKEEGIDELLNEVESALSRVDIFEAKYDAIYEAVENYSSFTGNVDNLETDIIFIFKTDTIRVRE